MEYFPIFILSEFSQGVAAFSLLAADIADMSHLLTHPSVEGLRENLAY